MTISQFEKVNSALNADTQFSSPRNLAAGTITFDLGEIAVVPEYFETLYLVGDASTAGWSPDNGLAPFVIDETVNYLFTYTGALVAGKLKITTALNADWCIAVWLNAAAEDQAIADAAYVERASGCPGDDFQWVVSAEDAGDYVVTVDLENETIAFAKQ